MSKFDDFYIPPLVIHPTGIEGATGQSVVFKFPFTKFVGILDVTASTGTVETLDVTLEELDPGSGDFFEFFAFGQAPADASNERLVENEDLATLWGPLIRAVWTLDEADSTFTFSVTLHGIR